VIAIAGTIPYDDRIHHSAEITELKFTLIEPFLCEVGSDLYGQGADIPIILCTGYSERISEQEAKDVVR